MSKTNLLWVLVAAWIGCTSTNDPVINAAPGDAGKDAKASGQADGGGTGTDGGTKKDGGGTTDDAGPTPCTPISGGLPCDKGKIYCGTETCDGATQECCVDLSKQPAATKCMAQGSCTQVTITCDEADDCAAGEVCCFTASGITPTGSSCMTGPCQIAGSPSDFAQSCRGDGECSTGSCVQGDCKGYQVQTCSAFPSSACQ